VEGKSYVSALDAFTGQYILPNWPAKPGQWISVYGTGFGPVEPAANIGEPAKDIARVTLPVRIRLGSRVLTAAEIAYVGLAPGFSGLYQVNLQVPSDMPNGNHELVLTLGEISSPTTGYLRVYK
jgi:uncharacterized protein (TIGR03437 family)